MITFITTIAVLVGGISYEIRKWDKTMQNESKTVE